MNPAVYFAFMIPYQDPLVCFAFKKFYFDHVCFGFVNPYQDPLVCFGFMMLCCDPLVHFVIVMPMIPLYVLVSYSTVTTCIFCTNDALL